MNAGWMLSATLFSLCAALAAWSAEQVARALSRPTRWVWAVAITVSLLSPALVRVLPPASRQAGISVLPLVRITERATSSLEENNGVWLDSVNRALLLGWFITSTVLLLRVVSGLRHARHLRRTSDRRTIGGVTMLVSEEAGPAVLGLAHPEIMYPHTLLSLSPSLRDLIIRHETEHLQARDSWFAFGCSMAVALLPWNLPLWWATRRARLALEIDCDDRVLRTHGNAVQYGKLLLLVAQRGAATSFAPSLTASRTHLERRIQAMLKPQQSNRLVRITLGSVGVLAMSLVACSTHVASAARIASRRVASSSTDASRRAELVDASSSWVGTAMPDTGTKPRTVANDTYYEFQVEQQVRQLPGENGLKYPPELRAAKVEGDVLAQFVVDESGMVIPATFTVLRSSHQAFSDAVREAVTTTRWMPAQIGGHSVRQLVQQPFFFALRKP